MKYVRRLPNVMCRKTATHHRNTMERDNETRILFETGIPGPCIGRFCTTFHRLHLGQIEPWETNNEPPEFLERSLLRPCHACIGTAFSSSWVSANAKWGLKPQTRQGSAELPFFVSEPRLFFRKHVREGLHRFKGIRHRRLELRAGHDGIVIGLQMRPLVGLAQ